MVQHLLFLTRPVKAEKKPNTTTKHLREMVDSFKQPLIQHSNHPQNITLASRDYCPPQDRMSGFSHIQPPHPVFQQDGPQTTLPETCNHSKKCKKKALPLGKKKKKIRDKEEQTKIKK